MYMESNISTKGTKFLIQNEVRLIKYITIVTRIVSKGKKKTNTTSQAHKHRKGEES